MQMKTKYLSESTITAGDCLRRFFLGWLVAAAVEYSLLSPELRPLNGMEGIGIMSLFRLMAITGAVILALSLLPLGVWTKRGERWGLLAAFLWLAAASLRASFTAPFLCVCLVLMGVLGVYAWKGWNGAGQAWGPPQEKRRRMGLRLAAGSAFGFFLFVSIWTVCRVLVFSAPTYDFGIFSQMFHNMRTTGLPMTTLERDGPLSHFCVHVSPVYYLLLPFYCVYPKPVTLQVLQAAVMASAAIPMWKIAGRHGFSPVARALLCLLLFLYPAYSGGAGYDLHENAFLTPLLLWLFFAIDSRKGWLMALTGPLTLLVKEDAAVYVAIVALWLVLSSVLQKQRWGMVRGGMLLAVAGVWFLLVTGYLARYGDGVMTYRYNNFMFEGSSSLLAVIQTAFLAPMKVLYECVDEEKLRFLGLTLLPLGGLPLWTRKYERFVLLIPYVLVNLMSDYPYQHDIFFQYTFGSTACLFYLTVVNLEDIGGRLKGISRQCGALLLALAASAACFGAVVVPRAASYPARYLENPGDHDSVEEFFSQIPKNASVTATTFYTVPLSQRETVYDVRYSSRENLLSTAYVVLDVNDTDSYKPYATDREKTNGLAQLVALLEEEGYTRLDEMEGRLVIYGK